MAASSAETAAWAWPAMAKAREAAIRVCTNFILLFSCSKAEKYADQKVVLRVR
ncbi:hypothetical protein D3C80_2094760 [compost metagenome]